MSRKDTPDASRVRRLVDAKPIRPIRPAQGGALGEAPPRAEASLPRLDPDAGNRRIRRVVLNGPPRPEFRGKPVARCRTHTPRKASFPKGRRRPQATLDLSLRTRPLRRVQVSRLRTTSLGRIRIRPSVPPGFDTLGVSYMGGKVFRQSVPFGHLTVAIHRCFHTLYALASCQDHWPKVASQDKTQ